MAAGKPQKQAVAIALHTAHPNRRPMHKAGGGKIDKSNC